jgi:hypothetical protein
MAKKSAKKPNKKRDKGSRVLVNLLADQLNWALQEMERQHCRHEDIDRGGCRWTIGRMCGKKWADDQGGFVEYIEPLQYQKIRDLLQLARDF